ncbi:MAG TPA: hypothetical protein VJ583_10055 [Nitrososphaeraceae archaeon]|nr:hypothetical protein [Nitrososphaeraceae archaeon]
MEERKEYLNQSTTTKITTKKDHINEELEKKIDYITIFSSKLFKE